MVNLSTRLKMVADMVSAGLTVADIGCDHAFTSIYLVEQGTAPSCIAADLRRGPLSGAALHIEEAGLPHKITTRLSDGLKEIAPGETDAVLISGMGGPLIASILENSIDTTKKARELILSPQSEPEAVRHFLKENGFFIEKEAMCFDEGKYYICIKAKPVENASSSLWDSMNSAEGQEDDFFFRYGRYLFLHPTDVFLEYLQHEADMRKKVREALKAKATGKAAARLEDVEKEIWRLEYEISCMRKRM